MQILYKQFHRIYLQADIKLLLVTVNNRLKIEIKIVHDIYIVSPYGSFRRHSRSQSLVLAWKKRHLTIKPCIHQSKEMYYNKINKKLKPGLVVSYDIWPGNGEGLFLFWCFINLLLTQTLTAQRPTRDRQLSN